MPQYQVALSFAGEQRPYVERVARALQSRGVTLFYDRFEKATLWGKDGVEFFEQVFSTDAACVVMFISAEYVAKPWTTHERRSALGRALHERGGYVLPVRFDGTPVPGVPHTMMYENASDHSPEALAALICQKMGLEPGSSKASAVSPPHMASLSGEAAFDYSSFNGRYMIGDGTLAFETAWSKASDTSIYILDDPPTINGVAIAKAVGHMSEITDAAALDYSSRVRTAHLGGVAVLRNTNGFYAAVQIVAIKDDTRGADRDELRFRYAIQRDGSASFQEFTDV